MNNLDVPIFEKLLIVCVDLCTFNAVFLGRFDGSFFDNVAESNHLSILYFLERGHMLSVGDAAASDYTYFYCSVHFKTPLFGLFYDIILSEKVKAKC